VPHQKFVGKLSDGDAGAAARENGNAALIDPAAANPIEEWRNLLRVRKPGSVGMVRCLSAFIGVCDGITVSYV
jgi:hypothetical protein